MDDDEFEDVSREQVRAAAEEHAVACVALLVAPNTPLESVPPDTVMDGLINSQLLSSKHMQRIRADRQRMGTSRPARIVGALRRLATRPWVANRYVGTALRVGQTTLMFARLVSLWTIVAHLSQVLPPTM